MMGGELAPEQALAVMQAMYKVIGAAVSTKDPDSLRGRMDGALWKLYHDHGIVGRIPIMDDDGHQIGLLAGKTTKPREWQAVRVRDRAELMADQADLMADYVAAHDHDFALWLVEQGIEPAGVVVERATEPGGEWAGTALTGCRPEDVLPALAPQLGTTLRAMLPEGGA